MIDRAIMPVILIAAASFLGYGMYNMFCSTHSEIVSPNGRPGAIAHCPIARADCLVEVSKVCKNGYLPIEGQPATETTISVECK